MSTTQKFDIILLILGSICLLIWFLWFRLELMIYSLFRGIDFITDFGETMNSSMSIFFGFGVILIITAFVVRYVEKNPNWKYSIILRFSIHILML